MSDFNAHVDDIALFFAKDGAPAKRWVPHSVYADPSCKLPAEILPPNWNGSVFSQIQCDGGYYYLVNLSLLLDPGVSPYPTALGDFRGGPPTPQNGDLVVVPWDRGSEAYLVKKTRYEDERECPPLVDPTVSDLVYAAIDEGVVVANLPRPGSLVGATCYLLSLISLKSGAIDPKDNKSAQAARLKEARAPRERK
jgi:hypothetical protein